MHNNEYDNTYIDTNECTSRGACSIAPNIAALQEIILYFLKHTANYILKLENMGANNPSVKYEIINDIASLVYINEFSENQLFEIAMKEYFLYTNTKEAYKQNCEKYKKSCVELKNKIKLNNSTTIAKVISAGEKLFLDKYNRISSEQRNLIDILEIVIKSTAVHLSKLIDFGEFDEETFHSILSALDLFNHSKIENHVLTTFTSQLAEHDYQLNIRISKLLLNKYGAITKTDVSYSTVKGKAILVSGSNFSELLKVLKNTQNENIDIYTHSDLLLAHSLSEFKKYPNLKGHFGDQSENNILDFATFPGSILLTKNAKKNTEYLYRGRLFSNGYIVPKGVIKIENNDYTELISSAKNAKGFSKGKEKPSVTLGYDEAEIKKNFQKIASKLKQGDIKRLYIIGMNTYSEIQKEYFNHLLNSIQNDEFVISFTPGIEKNNVLTINLGNYFPLAINLLHNLFTEIPIENPNVYLFITNCNVMVFTGIITLKKHNAKNIYMADCTPTFINPSVFKTFQNEYDIKITTNATNDISHIRNNQ